MVRTFSESFHHIVESRQAAVNFLPNIQCFKRGQNNRDGSKQNLAMSGRDLLSVSAKICAAAGTDETSPESAHELAPV